MMLKGRVKHLSTRDKEPLRDVFGGAKDVSHRRYFYPFVSHVLPET